jgi:hypothetical protein
MKPNLLFTNILIITLGSYCAQDSLRKCNYKLNNTLDLSISSNINQHCFTLSWVKFHSITKKERFKLGYGLRFTAQGSKNLYYVTAPAILTSKQTGPQVLFSPIYYENVDTFYVFRSQNNLINISINMQYTIKRKIDIGFNIDAVGISFGRSTTGKYMAYQSPENGSQQTARPTTYNLLLVSDNDIGALNSELYLRYWINPKWAIKCGATFLFTEYTTNNRLRLDNDRWRNKALMGLAGITFSPFKK